MLQDGRIDGFFYTVGHPNGNIKEATAGMRKARIIPIPEIKALFDVAPYYSMDSIDMAQYPEATNASEGKIPTVGMKATLITSANVDEEVVYNLTKAVLKISRNSARSTPPLPTLPKKACLKVCPLRSIRALNGIIKKSA